MSQLACGPFTVHWLTPEVQITLEALRAKVHPSEWELAHTFASPRRRNEYLRSRYMLRWLTGASEPLPAFSSRAPRWPEPWVGSLTHKDGFVGITLLAADEWLSVGIDAEAVDRMRESFAPRLAKDSELALLKDATARYGWSLPHALTILFSFKEALFKAHYPLGEQFFYFHDAEVTRLEVAADHQHGLIEAKLGMATSPLTPAGTLVTGHFHAYEMTAQSERRMFILTALGVSKPREGEPRIGKAGSTGSDISG